MNNELRAIGFNHLDILKQSDISKATMDNRAELIVWLSHQMITTTVPTLIIIIDEWLATRAIKSLNVADYDIDCCHDTLNPALVDAFLEGEYTHIGVDSLVYEVDIHVAPDETTIFIGEEV